MNRDFATGVPFGFGTLPETKFPADTMIPRSTILALLVLTPALAAEPLHLYELRTTDPKENRIVQGALSPEGTVTIDGAKFPVGDLVSLRATKTPLPPLPAEAHIVLANGDRIAGEVVGGDGLTIRVAAMFGAAGKATELSLPLSAVAAIWLVPPPQDAPLDAAKYAWVDPAKKQDALKLRNGDIVRGTLERFAAASGPLRFKAVGETTAKPFDLNKVAALAFDPALSRVKTPTGQHFRIVTRSGSRLTLTAASFDGLAFSGTASTGAKFKMPQSELVALDTVGGKVTMLAERKPKSLKVEPFGSVDWPPVVNRSVRDAPLRLATRFGDETYDRGVGMHSKTTATYDLAGKFRTFTATVGLDRVSGRQGIADVRILLDGKEQNIAGLKGLTTVAVEIHLDVSGAKELALIVDFGPGGDVQDDVNWADAKLIE